VVSDNEQRVYDVLDKLEIPYIRYEHEPVFTVEAASNLDIHIKGKHCKNLFIRNRKGDKHYLVIVIDTKRVDLKSLANQINSTNLSFASERRLLKHLGLKPGSVSPFGLINDSHKHVEVLIDQDLMGSKDISFHPNVNTVTITLTYKDFEKFIEWCGNKTSYFKID